MHVQSLSLSLSSDYLCFLRILCCMDFLYAVYVYTFGNLRHIIRTLYVNIKYENHAAFFFICTVCTRVRNAIYVCE